LRPGFRVAAIPCRALDRQQLDRGAASAHPGIMASVGRGTMKHVAVALAAALALSLQAQSRLADTRARLYRRSGAARRLRRSIAAEMALALVVLSLVGL
jgi:copper transport protein